MARYDLNLIQLEGEKTCCGEQGKRRIWERKACVVDVKGQKRIAVKH
jgi:hypothetical protein